MGHDRDGPLQMPRTLRQETRARDFSSRVALQLLLLLLLQQNRCVVLPACDCIRH